MGSHKIHIDSYDEFEIPVHNKVKVPVEIDTNEFSQMMIGSSVIKSQSRIKIIKNLQSGIKQLGNNIVTVIGILLLIWVFKND
jgi:hypothetical protein